MAKYTDYKIEEAKYLINEFIKHNEKPDFTDIPKYYIMENVIFHNHGYQECMYIIEAFCNNGLLEKCKTCPHKEYCPKIVKERKL